MDINFDTMSAMDQEMATMFGIVYLIYYLVIIGVGIAGYVLGSLGLHAIARRRGIANPWLAWIPVANAWIVGSISDQFRYVTRGQIKNKRKALLALSIVSAVCVVLAYVFLFATIGGLAGAEMSGSGDIALGGVVGGILGALVSGLVAFGVSIALLVVRCIAMYDLYTSVNPAYNVAFLVLSIIFNVTEPYFIFFNRKKDLGMPPRSDASAAAAPRPAIQELWENNAEA